MKTKENHHLTHLLPSGFSPKPLEQSYTLHSYQGCYSAAIRSSLSSQVRSQLETSLPCRSHQQCEVYSVQCRGDGTGSKLSVVVEPTMLGALEDQWEVLAAAARFLRESFNPVFSSVRVLINIAVFLNTTLQCSLICDSALNRQSCNLFIFRLASLPKNVWFY